MKLLFISLGCDKNLVDSEMMMGLLHDRGYEFTDNEEEADIIVINTCGFINDAKEESINTILEMAKYKENNLKALIVAGCLVERCKNEILQELPEIDAIVGTTAFDKICDVVDDVLADKKHNELESINKMCRPDVKRIITTGGYYSYLKIAEGCDKHCTYCIIPKVRGDFRSVPMEHLLEEAQNLADGGVKELILVAQETTLYGTDIYGKKSLHLLLKELCKIKGIRWIRVQYCYPEEITDELIETITQYRLDYVRRLIDGLQPDVIFSHDDWGTKNALFMKNEIAGVNVPDELVERYPENAGRREGEAVGIELARQMIAMTQDFADGYYFEFPFNRTYMLKEILK